MLPPPIREYLRAIRAFPSDHKSIELNQSRHHGILRHRRVQHQYNPLLTLNRDRKHTPTSFVVTDLCFVWIVLIETLRGFVHRLILVVDDNQHVRAQIRSSIEHHTDRAVCGEAENGKIAVAMVLSLKPHLVVLDLSMPVMNGLDAALEISTIVPGMPMIMFTLHDSAVIRELALGVGIKHVFSKANGFGDDVIEAMRMMLVA